jgi:hypothetical protein
MWPESENNGPTVKPFRQTQLYHEWYGRVAMGNPNDYVIAISAHPGYTGVSGSGKTTLAGGLAEKLDFSPGGFQAETQFTVDAGVLAYDMYGATEEGATLIGDEMQGTAANTNLNSKRSMKTESLDVYSTIAGNRKGRKTLILVFQTLDKAMKDMFDFVDAWLLIVDDVNYRCNHYKVLPEPFNFESNKTKTPRVETLTWGALPADNENYQEMERKKDQANAGNREYGSDEEEAAQSIPTDLRNQQIKAAYDRGQTQNEIAKHWDLTQQAVSTIVNND